MATKSDTRQRSPGAWAESDDSAKRARLPKLTSNGFNVHLAAPRSQNESCRFQFEQLVGTCIQYASSLLAAIGRDCSIGANHAQICMLTSVDLTTHVAIARLWMVRAHFNKRSAQAFSKADHHLNICNTPLAFEYRQSQSVCSRGPPLPNGDAS
jgi:hypothetical protein